MNMPSDNLFHVFAVFLSTKYVHTHTHIYIYVCVCVSVWICVYKKNFRKNLKSNYCALVETYGEQDLDMHLVR